MTDDSSIDASPAQNSRSDVGGLDNDETIIKKPSTFELLERPRVERTTRYGELFLGKTARLRLEIRGSAHAPVEVELTNRYVIGRSATKSQKKPDLDLNRYGGYLRGISREHLAIIKDDSLLKVEDLGSTNGSYLNGSKLLPHQPRILRDGDELCLGTLILRVDFILPGKDETKN
jgi:hypothetical protein